MKSENIKSPATRATVGGDGGATKAASTARVKADKARVDRLKEQLGSNPAEVDFAHKNVIDYELLPYHRFGLGKYEYLGKVYEPDDYKTPSDEVVKHLQAIIDKEFGRSPSGAPEAHGSPPTKG